MVENKAGAARYQVAANRSRFIVRAFATGLLSALAHNPTIAIRNFTGEARFAPVSPDDASLQLSIKTNSLEVTDDVSDKDRREIERQIREEVLESDRYPEIFFESDRVSSQKITDSQFRARIDGKLSLRGVTRPCSINAQVWLTGDMLRAQGEFPLRQSDFNIKPVTAAAGTIKLKDELKFSFDIVAQKQ